MDEDLIRLNSRFKNMSPQELSLPCRGLDSSYSVKNLTWVIIVNVYTDMNLTVPDFSISVYGMYLMSSLLFLPHSRSFLFLFNCTHKAGWDAKKYIGKKEKKWKMTKLLLHELPYTEHLKPGTIGLASELLEFLRTERNGGSKEYLSIQKWQQPPSSFLNLSFALESRKL